MYCKFKIKKNDTVLVISGKNKGIKGDILSVIPGSKKVIVSGINILVDHVLDTKTNKKVIKRREFPIHISNVMIIDPETSLPSRVGYKLQDGNKVRCFKPTARVVK